MHNLLILTEGGEGIGYGHVSRCSAINDYLKELKFNSEILVNWYGENSNITQNVKWLENEEVIKEKIKTYDFVLVDSYKAPLSFFLWLKQVFKKVFVIDDYGRFLDFGVDLIINPNIYANKIPYQADFIGGKDYVILREGFRKCSDKLIIKEKASSILVTLGGSDFRGLLPIFIESFKRLPYNFNFICGSEQYANELFAKFKNIKNYNYFGFLSDKEMRGKMLNVDIAISACGQTLHELAYLGIPTIGICIDQDQELNANEYLELGFLFNKINWYDPALVTIIQDNLYSLLNFERRFFQNKLGRRLITAKGLEYIEKAIYGDRRA